MENDLLKNGANAENEDSISDKELLINTPENNFAGSTNSATCWLKGMIIILWRPFLLFAITLFVLFAYFFVALPWLQNLQPIFSSKTVCTLSEEPTSEKDIQAFRQRVAKAIKNDKKDLKAKIPRTPFLVINTTENKFYLRSGDQTLRIGFCSTGSLIVLKKSEEEEWAFQTPRGIRTIRSKTTEPVWKKPDWAFVEEGLPIPSQNDPSRYDYATLGDYSLSLGNGYLIHGTLYQRLLGMPVTHGCIRLGDDDLEVVYKTLQLGSKVYIY